MRGNTGARDTAITTQPRNQQNLNEGCVQTGEVKRKPSQWGGDQLDLGDWA